MKYFLVVAGITFLLSACDHSNKAVKERIAGADSMAINYFTGDGKMDSVAAVKIIRNKVQIDQLAAMIGERVAENDSACGVDGSLHFFKMNKVIQDVDFRMTGNCSYFYFVGEGKPNVTALSADAKKLLEQLRP